jgi:TfoX/Sxy family transcriptional regulator of competence genes
MAFNLDNEYRIDAILERYPSHIRGNFTKKKMFGGLAYLYFGKMTIGLVGGDLMVRVVSEKMNAVLSTPHVRPMDFTKRPMKEFVYVGENGFSQESELEYWLGLGLEHASGKIKPQGAK